MSYVRRQRLSWARIKLSCFWYLSFSFEIYKSNLSVLSSSKLLTFFIRKKLLKKYLFGTFPFLISELKKIYRFGLFSKGFYCLFFNVLCCPHRGTICIILWFFFFVNTFFKKFFIFLFFIFINRQTPLNFYNSSIFFLFPFLVFLTIFLFFSL